MVLAQVIEVERGRRVLRVFRSVERGTLFVAVDRIIDGRRSRGVLLSEADIRCLADLVEQCKPIALRALQRRDGKEEARQRWNREKQVQLDLHEAVERIRSGGEAGGDSMIQVVPSMPEYTYKHTCSLCGCHIESLVRLGPGVALKLCPSCQHVHKGTW